MEQPEVDIYKALKKNNIITKLVIIVAGLVSVFAIYTVVQSYKNNNKFVYGLSKDNSLLPLELIEKKQLETIFVKGHLELFMTKFYQYDQWNYIDQIERSLWLIDESGKDLYFFYKNNGHYNALIQSGSSQSIDKFDIQTDQSGQFIVKAIVSVNKKNQIDKNSYEIICQGKIVKVSQNYPKNPYGYLITDFKEVSKRKLEL